MKRILHSNLVNHSLGTKPVGRAVVVHASRPIFATCTVDDLARLEQIDPSPDDGDEEAGRTSTAGAGDVARTVFNSPGAITPDESPAGARAAQFENAHTARVLGIAPQYSEQSGPELLQEGVRVTWAAVPGNDDRKAIAYEFDSSIYSEDDCREFLAEHHVTDFTFQPDARDQVPVTHGSREEPEKPPEGFSTIGDFLQSTIACDEDDEGSDRPHRVRHAEPDAVLRHASAVRTRLTDQKTGLLFCRRCGGAFRSGYDVDGGPEKLTCPLCGAELDDEAENDLELAASLLIAEVQTRERANSAAAQGAVDDAAADAEAAHSAGGVDQYLADLDGDAIRHAGEQLGEQFALADALDGACEFLSNKQLLW
jgi:hypothetical protein